MLLPLMILIAGPYRSGTGDDPVLMEQNLRTLEAAALPLFRAGHIPVIGEWLAPPLLREAGSQRPGDAIYDEIVYQTGFCRSVAASCACRELRRVPMKTSAWRRN